MNRLLIRVARISGEGIGRYTSMSGIAVLWWALWRSVAGKASAGLVPLPKSMRAVRPPSGVGVIWPSMRTRPPAAIPSRIVLTVPGDRASGRSNPSRRRVASGMAWWRVAARQSVGMTSMPDSHASASGRSKIR